jgi:type II secretion system protein N
VEILIGGVLEILRKLRFVLYPSVFALVFIFAAYCTFPKAVVRDLAENSLLNAAISMGPRANGLPQVALKDVSLWRLSGISLQGLTIVWPLKKNESPFSLEIESLKARTGIFALLTGARSIYADANLYDGELSTRVKIRPKNNVDFINIDGEKINLAKVLFIEPMLGAPLAGVISLSVDLSAKSDLLKDGNGFIKLNLDNLSYGPGSINLPAGGFVSSLTVPKVNLGKLTADLTLEKGQFESKAFSLAGGDIEADLKLSIALGKRPSSSKITGDGWFSIKREFINANETIKMLFDLIPELRNASQRDGKIGLTIRGTLARPIPKIEQFVGERKEPKKEPMAKADK